MTKRVAILISGGGSNMMSLVQDMNGDHPCRPCIVISNLPEAGGLAKAASAGIETLAIDHKQFGKDRSAFESALHDALVAAAPDIVCLAGFMRILSPAFMAKWDGRMLNIHPSLLPKYRGLHTHQRAIDAGDDYHGCTVHEVTAELDGGPILGQARIAIAAGDTTSVLAAKVLPFEHQLYPMVLRRFAAGDRDQVVLGV
ncbi:MAG: phosphoribosylglycinamide formyltransferase-1 [Gammaproteobacteria bacterium]